MQIIKNTDKTAQQIEKKLEENFQKYGARYCPCQPTHSDDTKCMCKSFRETIANSENAECHCGLYSVRQ